MSHSCDTACSDRTSAHTARMALTHFSLSVRNCWKCPTSDRFTLTDQIRRGDKEWTCVFKYDPPIWQFWNLIDRLDSGPKHWLVPFVQVTATFVSFLSISSLISYYDTYYGEWTGQQSCSGYTCDYGCVYHMVDTCRTWN